MRACPLCPREAPRDAGEPCLQCGRAVCAGHRWAMLGLCHECATEEEVASARRVKTTHPSEFLDIKWLR